MARVFSMVLAISNSLASLWILFLMLLISADVIGRSFFNHPLPGIPEIVKFSIVGMFWLQMAHALRERKHLRTTLLLRAMPRALKRLVMVLNSLLGLVVFGLIAWLAWPEMMESYEYDIFEGEHPVRILVWPIWGILVFGAALTAVQFALDAVRYIVQGPSPDETDEVAK